MPFRGSRVAIIALMLSGGLITTPLAQGATPGPNGLIAFTSDRTGNSKILRMNASNGGGIVNLSRNGALDAYPAW